MFEPYVPNIYERYIYMATDEIKIRKGFNYYCVECDKAFRYAKTVEKKDKLWNWLTCPDCGEILTDLKRK